MILSPQEAQVLIQLHDGTQSVNKLYTRFASGALVHMNDDGAIRVHREYDKYTATEDFAHLGELRAAYNFHYSPQGAT